MMRKDNDLLMFFASEAINGLLSSCNRVDAPALSKLAFDVAECMLEEYHKREKKE